MGRNPLLMTAAAMLVVAIGTALANAASATLAEKRVALVIGNAAYEQAPPLANPTNDAAAVSDALEELGFDVTRGTDLTHEGMREVIRTFSDKIEGADLALFFYAGHGVQVWGENYLIPVDAKLATEADLDFAAVKIDLVMRQMMRDARVKVVILDACRDNPLSRSLARSMGATRSAQAIAPGLAEITTGAGSLIAFATEPGAVALDGDTRHSPFTAALLEHMAEPGVELQTVMTRVRGQVYQSTAERQLPWVNTSLTGEVYLVPALATLPAAGAADAPPAETVPDGAGSDGNVADRLELALWESAERTDDARAYREYLKQYPDGRFATVAALRLEAADAESTPTAQESEETLAAATLPATPVPAVSRHAQPPAEAAQSDSGAGDAAAAEAAEAALGLSRSQRAEVQRRLTLIGYDTKGVDGAFGANSRAAIARWQAAGGKPETGYLDAAQHAALIDQSGKAYAAWLAARPKPRPAAAAALPAADLSTLPPGPPDTYRYGRPGYGGYRRAPPAAPVTGARPDRRAPDVRRFMPGYSR